MDKRTEELRNETTNLNATAKSLRATLASLNNTLSTADLRASVAALEAERTEILERLTALRAGTVRPVSKEEKEQVDKDMKAWEKVLITRRKIVKDMWGQIMEGLPEGVQANELKVSG
jgi:26S proteasome regulatory subunit (ATPase 3-interacting protein)